MGTFKVKESIKHGKGDEEKVLKEFVVNIKTGSRKTGDKVITAYKDGETVEMSTEDALAHDDVLEINPAQIEAMKKEEEATKKAETKKASASTAKPETRSEGRSESRR